MKFSLVIKKVFKLLFDHRPITNIMVKIALLPPNELLNGRCALVTGGTSGIGYAIAKAYVNAGAVVIITGRSKERINAAIRRLKIECSEATVFGCVLNNTQVSTFEKTFDDILSEVKVAGVNGIDILVNNAGVNYKGMPERLRKNMTKCLTQTSKVYSSFRKCWVNTSLLTTSKVTF